MLRPCVSFPRRLESAEVTEPPYSAEVEQHCFATAARQCNTHENIIVNLNDAFQSSL